MIKKYLIQSAILFSAIFFLSGYSYSQCVSYDVKVCIDGSDTLKVQGDTMWWAHRHFQNPGQHPSCISNAGVTILVDTNAWSKWDSAYHIQNVSCDTLTVLFDSCFNSCQLLQSPNAGNGWQTMFYFDDDNKGGPHYYEVILQYCPAGLTPPTSTFIAGSPVCAGQNDTITYTGTGSNAATYTWNFAGGTVVSGSGRGPYIVHWDTAGTYNVTLDVIECGPSTTTTVTVTVSPAPTINVSPDTAVCGGTPVQLSASGGATYLWSPGVTLNDSTKSNPVATPLAATTYTVIVADAIGCKATGTVNVSLSGSIAANIVSQTNVSCHGWSDGTATVSSTGSSPFTYQWSPSGSTTDTDSGLVAGTYNVTVTSNGGCSGTTSVTITEPPPMVLNFKRVYYICESGTVTLTATGGTSYTWSPGATLNDSTIANPKASPFISTTYTVTVYNGACYDTATVSVIQIIPPLPPTITVIGDSLSIPQGYTNYQWYYQGGPIGGATNYYYIAKQTGYYSVYITDSNDCHTVTAAVYVLITGVSNNLQDAEIKIYPNPAKDRFTVYGLQYTKGTTLDIYNVLGEKVYGGQPQTENGKPETVIDVSALAKGVYLVLLRSENREYRSLVVKE